jgi:hypothetical protein
MPDTLQNQAMYPQLASQAEGVGFPIARLVAVICLASGALIDAAIGPFQGKGNSELGLLRELEGALSAGDVLLGDAFYCNFFVIAALLARGIDGVFAQNSARTTDFRRGQSLGVRDHRVSWRKPPARPQWMDEQQFDELPEQITLREVKVDGQLIVTTMLDEQEVCKAELGELYALRWHAELDLRNIKVTLGLDVLSCKTPAMNEKQLWTYLLAYNLIRVLMAQAAANADRRPREISFKHTVQIWSEWTTQCRNGDTAQNAATLFRLIAQIKVNQRPGRFEPRARKRRPKPYEWLKESRSRARWRVATAGHGRKVK